MNPYFFNRQRRQADGTSNIVTSPMQLLALLILISSCGSEQHKGPTPMDQQLDDLKLVHSPAIDYPAVDYDEVVFYRVNEKHYRDHALLPLNEKR